MRGFGIVGLFTLFINVSCTDIHNGSREHSTIPAGWKKISDGKNLIFYAPSETVMVPTQVFDCCGGRLRNKQFSINYFYNAWSDTFGAYKNDKSVITRSVTIDKMVSRVVHGRMDEDNAEECGGEFFEAVFVKKDRIFQRPLYLEFTVCTNEIQNLPIAEKIFYTIKLR